MTITCVVIGAGIVGLHVARVFQEKGCEVFVLDQAPYLAEHTSGRNSGVIHSGIFYTPGSLKEKLCIEGNRLTYEWVRKLNVPHRACGKWVVPENGQESELDPFFERIESLPIPSPERVSKEKLPRRETALRPTDSIFIPSTGIVDAAAYVKSLATHLEGKGVQIIYPCRVSACQGNLLATTRGEIPFDLCVNTAGLQADEVACLSGLNLYKIRPCRGDYYLLNKQPMARPVYHLPYRGAAGLGVHLTPTLDGQTLLGPNAFYIEEKQDYKHRSPPDAFEKAVRFYLPDLGPFQIQKAYSGNRPKLYQNGKSVDDFVIERKDNWVHLLGIESPGLTAAPALAQATLKISGLLS